MIVFTYQYLPEASKITMELHSDSTLDQVIEEFEIFLRASGYTFDGHIEITENKEN